MHGVLTYMPSLTCWAASRNAPLSGESSGLMASAPQAPGCKGQACGGCDVHAKRVLPCLLPSMIRLQQQVIWCSDAPPAISQPATWQAHQGSGSGHPDMTRTLNVAADNYT